MLGRHAELFHFDLFLNFLQDLIPWLGIKPYSPLPGKPQELLLYECRPLRALNPQLCPFLVSRTGCPRGPPRCWSIQELPARKDKGHHHPSLESGHSCSLTSDPHPSHAAWGAGPSRNGNGREGFSNYFILLCFIVWCLLPRDNVSAHVTGLYFSHWHLLSTEDPTGHVLNNIINCIRVHLLCSSS